MKYRLRNILFLPLLLTLLSACSDEEPDGPQPGDFKTLDFHLMLSSEVDESPEKSDSDEGMRDVRLVITDVQGKILLSNTYDIEWKEGDPAVVEKIIRLEEVPKEAAYVYAFSNLDSELLENRTEILAGLEMGKTLPVSFDDNGVLAGSLPNAKIAESLNQRFNIPGMANGNKLIPRKEAIPMSSHFHKLDAEEISIPLYRMVAKVKLSLLNMSGEEVKISPINLERARHTGLIYTLPYEALMNLQEDDRPLFPQSISITELSGLYNNLVLKNGESTETTCYLHELTLSGRSDSIRVKVKFSVPTNMERYGVTRFTYVRRNDFLVIPLVISDYALKVTIGEQRAPIGGYPFTFEMDLVSSQTYFIKNEGELTIDLAVIKKSLTGKDEPVTGFTAEDWSLVSKEEDAIVWIDEPQAGGEVRQIKLKVNKRSSATLSFKVVVNSKTIPYTINLIYN